MSIGILAWNEEAGVGGTIRSLFEQTIFHGGLTELDSVEVACVPNGCTDATAERARAALEAALLTVPRAGASARVTELSQPGKANAWNEYVHRISDSAADYLILMDADVTLPRGDTIERLLRTLDAAPGAVIATARPVKAIAMKSRQRLMERVSVRLSELVQAKGRAVAGALYCARAGFLRESWLPVGVIGDDSFLKLLVITDQCRSAGLNDRVVRAPETIVVFEPPSGLRDIMHHQRRQKVAHGINMILYEFLRSNVTPLGAGPLIQKLNAEEPDWVRRVVRERVVKGGWWVMPRGVVRARLKQLRGLPARKLVWSVPVVSAAALVDAGVMIAANSVIRRGALSGIWRRSVKK